MRKLILKDKNAITLISLVVTIVLIVILAAVAINVTIGNNGLFAKAKYAKEETLKSQATEKIQFKITTAQMELYGQNTRMPTLKELGVLLQQDNEIQYVEPETQEKKVADISKTDWSKEEIQEPEIIYTKLKNYEYEFGINSTLQLASVNGVKVAATNTVSQEQYEALLARIQALENANYLTQSNAASTYATKTELQNTNTTSNSIDYSNTNEKQVGKSYDGKTLYEKVISITIPTTNTDGTCAAYDLNLASLNANKLWIVEGYVSNSSGNVVSLPLFANTANNKLYFIYMSNTKMLRINSTNTAYNGATGYITVHYTKN